MTLFVYDLLADDGHLDHVKTGGGRLYVLGIAQFDEATVARFGK